MQKENDTLIAKVLALFEERTVLRPRDLNEYGLPQSYLTRLYQRGQVERIGRGLYALPQANITRHHSLVQTVVAVPDGVVCLLSALQYYGLTTQNPSQVWLAIANKAHHPRLETPPVHIVRFSGGALTSGIQSEMIEGVAVKIYNPAKTVADCFKFRHKIGLDVALEALKDCYVQDQCSIPELWHYAEICRMTTVMKPYLEMLT